MTPRALYWTAGALGLGALVALISRRPRSSALLPGEPNWFLGKPMATVFVTEGWGHPRTGRPGHGGVDLRAPVGTPVFAVADGTVAFSGAYSEGNTAVEIDHGDGMLTRYLHHSQSFVKKGDRVKRGQRILLTGLANSPHLHFDVFVTPAQVPFYVQRFGRPAKLGEATYRGRVKVPSEPLIPTDAYQADVVQLAARDAVKLRAEASIA